MDHGLGCGDLEKGFVSDLSKKRGCSSSTASLQLPGPLGRPPGVGGGASCFPCCSFQSGTFLSAHYHHTFKRAHRVLVNVTLILKVFGFWFFFVFFYISFNLYRISQCSPELKPLSSALGLLVYQQGLSITQDWPKQCVQVECAVKNVLERLG